MNARKLKRRLTNRISAKNDKTIQNIKERERKSNIAAKRITLLPGFLINGYTSTTAKKNSSEEVTQKKKESLPNKGLHKILKQNSKTLRRSQRIFNKHFEEQNSSYSSCDNLDKSPLWSLPQKLTLSQNSTFKSILKNGSKSIFKEINERFLKVEQKNNIVQKQAAFPLQESSNMDTFVKIMVPQNCVLPKISNNLFCKDLRQQICVTLRRSEINECIANIKKKINCTNLILEGKMQIDNEFFVNSNETEQNLDITEPAVEDLCHISKQNWVYCTPVNQKIGVPKLDECQLQAAVMYTNRNRQNIYEMTSNFNFDFVQLKNNENVPIDHRFLNKVAQIKKPFANFVGVDVGEERNCPNGIENGAQNGFGDGLSTPVVSELNKLCTYKEKFSDTNYLNVIHPKKPIKNQVPKNILCQHSSATKGNKNIEANIENIVVDLEQDFTFIEDGDSFKIGHTQKNKRRLNDDEFVIKRRSVFEKPKDINIHIDTNSNKLFNFNTQDKSVFDLEMQRLRECDTNSLGSNT